MPDFTERQQRGNFFVCYSGGNPSAIFFNGADAADHQEIVATKNLQKIARGEPNRVAPWSLFIEYTAMQITYGNKLPIPAELQKRQDEHSAELHRKFGPPGPESFRKVLDELANGVERPSDHLASLIDKLASVRNEPKQDAAFKASVAESKKLHFRQICPGIVAAIVGIMEMQHDMGGTIDVTPVLESVLEAVYDFGASE